MLKVALDYYTTQRREKLHATRLELLKKMKFVLKIPLLENLLPTCAELQKKMPRNYVMGAFRKFQ